MALQDTPDYQPGLRIAAASNAMAGRPEQAHKAVARLRLVDPKLRGSQLKDRVGPFWGGGGRGCLRGAKTFLYAKKDCGKPGCPNGHRSQGFRPVATGDRMKA